MPYIVTTNRACDDYECNPNCRNRDRSRRAVATLEEARDYTHDLVIGFDPNHEPFGPCARAALDLSESGDTVGPLPDGTIIEVARVEMRKLREDAGLPFHPGGYRPEQVIDAYNAREGS